MELSSSLPQSGAVAQPLPNSLGGVPLTHVTSTREEVNHECRLSQVRQDGVVHGHQHLLVQAQGQLQGWC